jgi:hypothetical protein
MARDFTAWKKFPALVLGATKEPLLIPGLDFPHCFFFPPGFLLGGGAIFPDRQGP